MDKITISVGKSRFDKNWKNTELTWEKLAQRLAKPTITKETYTEYIKLGAKEQGDIKDVGGFVGGIVAGGRRKINSVSARYLITLDIDDPPQFFWDNWILDFEIESLLYSTHKHCSAKPRYRLIVPLAEPVHADEYEAAARMLARKIDIQYFVDDTTFQPERLMYWPSHSSDGEFVYERQQGRIITVDELLEMYDDWRDTSKWPRHEKSDKKIRDALAKQENPLEKAGVIGAFCQAYGVSAAIDKFIPDAYEETAQEDRWTFKAGSTHGGMIVYDDMFTFSHHSTDPSQGRLCNAFDLVRIHRFGHLDKDVADSVPNNKCPSFNKMVELVIGDSEVKKIMLKDKVDGIGEEGKEWLSLLEMDRKGNVISTANNVVVILDNDDWFKDNICYDDLEKVRLMRKDLPWRKIGRLNNKWMDSDGANLRIYLEKKYQITNSRYIDDALVSVTAKNTYHPIKQYLEKCIWDGKKRIETLLIDCFGAEDNPYTRTVTRKTLVAAVARIYEPGCKFETVLTLVGGQGVGKSRWIKALGMKWFSDTFGNLKNKDAMEQIIGVWIMEIGELAGLKKQEVDAVKLFIAKQEDRFRVAYGHGVENFPRQCIFIASTNDFAFQQDQTGGRRWWPVVCKKKWTGWFRQEEIDQIWAEACVLYAEGEDLHLDSVMDEMAAKVVELHTENDLRVERLKLYLDTLVPSKWHDWGIWEKREFIQKSLGDITIDAEEDIQAKGNTLRSWITIPEIWTELFNRKYEDMDNYSVRFIRTAMNQMSGWEPKMLNKKPYGHQRGWIRTGIYESILS